MFHHHNRKITNIPLKSDISEKAGNITNYIIQIEGAMMEMLSKMPFFPHTPSYAQSAYVYMTVCQLLIRKLISRKASISVTGWVENNVIDKGAHWETSLGSERKILKVQSRFYWALPNEYTGNFRGLSIPLFKWFPFFRSYWIFFGICLTIGHLKPLKRALISPYELCFEEID